MANSMYVCVFLFFNLLLSTISVDILFSQEKSPIEYPYGGIPDSSLMKGDFVPLYFKNAQFDSARFDRVANFQESYFNTIGHFENAYFKEEANFNGAIFYGENNFTGASFYAKADFSNAEFNRWAEFRSVRFYGKANFRNAIIEQSGNFQKSVFAKATDFRNALFTKGVNFQEAYFNEVADFRKSRLQKLNVVGATIAAKFTLGLVQQEIDFSKTIFRPNTSLELHELVALNLQPEKIKYISLGDTLSYFLKWDIIENLKSKSFKNDKQAQLELDYIFSKSTMYQDKSDTYQENKWYQIWKWPKWIGNTIYDWTMGLGYRPFQLRWWILAIIIIFTGIYMKIMPSRINAYITTNFNIDQNPEMTEIDLDFWATLLNCVYFSVMVFLTFRLKGNILTFFDTKEKILIVVDWLLGCSAYVAFLTLSEEGSILHNLKNLFFGS